MMIHSILKTNSSFFHNKLFW